MKAEDYGLIIGVAIMLLFGGLIAFFIPRVIRKHDGSPDRQADGNKMAFWMRILGLIVMGVGIIQLCMYLFLREPGV